MILKHNPKHKQDTSNFITSLQATLVRRINRALTVRTDKNRLEAVLPFRHEYTQGGMMIQTFEKTLVIENRGGEYIAHTSVLQCSKRPHWKKWRNAERVNHKLFRHTDFNKLVKMINL